MIAALRILPHRRNDVLRRTDEIKTINKVNYNWRIKVGLKGSKNFFKKILFEGKFNPTKL